MGADAVHRKALLIGASGQVGAQILTQLGSDRCIAACRNPSEPDWAAVDLAQLASSPALADQLLNAFAPIAVYCVGGMTDVERCESEPDLAMAVNCDGPRALAAASSASSIPFVYFSTEYVFDGRNGPYNETSQVNPISVYGRSKWLGECAILQVHPDALIIRTTVVYGMDPGGKNFLYTLRRVLQEGRTLRVPCDQISTPTYNRDLAAATIRLVESGYTGIIHIAGPEVMSRLHFAVQAASALGFDTNKIAGVPTSLLGQRAERPLSAGLLTDKLREVLPDFHMQTLEFSLQELSTYDFSSTTSCAA